METVHIDGSMGEGGGQVLRTSVSLSVVTGKPLVIEKIRASRGRPGLMRQHLTAVLGAAEISDAEVEGAELGSTRLRFSPKRPRGGDYELSVGTAGSAGLVLQTVLPALLVADGPSHVVFEGGTHNPMSPPFDFLSAAFVPLLERMGATVVLSLERPGFYPKGGGRFAAEVAPATLTPLELLDAGDAVAQRAMAIVSALPTHVGKRELRILEKELGLARADCVLMDVAEPAGPGNAVHVELEHEHVTELLTGFGKKGVPAERVARNLAADVRRFVSARVPVGEHLADQLLIPLAMAGGGTFRTVKPSLHTTTNAEVIQRFLDVRVDFFEESGGATRVTVS